MNDIKTKNTIKQKIRTINAPVIKHVKMASVKTKGQMQKGCQTDDNTATEYAVNRTSSAGDCVGRKSMTQINRYGRKNAQITKNNIIKAKDKIFDFKQKRAMDIRKKGVVSVETQKHTNLYDSRTAVYQRKRKIRHKIKSPVMMKKNENSIKTAQSISKISIKTSENCAKITRGTVNKSLKAAKKTPQVTAKVAKALAAVGKSVFGGTKALIAALIGGGWIFLVIIIIIIMISGALSLMGDGGDNSSSPLSEEVKGYIPIIQQYASQHGIPEYVQLCAAVMMQESGGRGKDPMQTSESGLNTKYPRRPNGITDPEYSINIGIKTLATCLRAAGVQNPTDMEHIKLALQGYNFGNGYIQWAVKKYKGYSEINAQEFSDMMAKKMGWDRYGDPQYVSHVLRYYSYSNISTGAGNQLVEVARTQIGNVGGQPYWSWYGFSNRVSWCACFVSWCANQCGYIDTGTIPKFSSCVTGVEWFRQHKQWKEKLYTPQPGDIIFFDRNGDGRSEHVGIVEQVKNGVIYTIEGNSGDRCRQRSYEIGNKSVLGYGIPSYIK